MVKVPKKTLAGVVGAVAAGVLAVVVPKFEGVKLVGYLDPVGIPTRCMGAVDQRTTKERNEHEAENRSLRAALAAGTERLRVAVRNCTAAGRDGVPGASGTAGVGDGAAAYADVDAAVAERVFGVAGDDQREIDKLTALQGYVCAVRPETPGCERK